MAKHVLVTIGFSHFCEKARWALDYHQIKYEERSSLPLFHMLATYGAGGGRTVPVLKSPDGVFKDSTDILKYLDSQVDASRRLLDLDGEHGLEVQALEDEFDRRLGPATRVLAYHILLDEKAYSKGVMKGAGSGLQRALAQPAFPVVSAMIRRAYRISDETAERSRKRLEDIFDKVELLLQDGRPYLTGDRFTAADITFASLTAPLVLPPQHGYPMPPLEENPIQMQKLVEEVRSRPAGEYVMKLYETSRYAL